MDIVDRVLIFNSTVLVYWAVVILPRYLKTGKRHLYQVHCMGMFFIEEYLFWDIHGFPDNVFRGAIIFFMALAASQMIHQYDTRIKILQNTGKIKKSGHISSLFFR